ncbi:MAG: FtsX-like permease family protein [Candidatus Thalassarchaeaceae archaeon]|jgi:putative ABC transport system permease protein|nr:FtsX-like permease family protein [Candidatus Thalassarchaeaceae archaeon]
MSLTGPWSWPRKAATAGSGLACLTIVAYFSFGAQSDENDWSMGRILTSIGLSAIGGFVAWTGIQWLVSSRHRILATMARNNLTRRKRNSALVIVGLLVGSAIVSSSLVIGDSLDSTMDQQFLAPLGDTDYYIRGENPVTGLWTEWNQTRANALSDELSSRDDVIGVRPGLSLYASVLNDAESLGDPAVVWYAFDENRSSDGIFAPIGGANGVRYADILEGNVVINQELAESASAGVGDVLEVHWLDVDLEEGIIRDSTNLTVQSIITDVSTGHMTSNQPLIFTSLHAAQSITGKQDIINHIGIAVKGDGNDNLQSEITTTLNGILIAEDAGLTVESDAQQGTIAIARTSGLGQLEVGEVANVTAIINETNIDASIIEMLQVPLYNIAQESINLSGLKSSSIASVEQSSGWDWYATAAGLSLQDASGEWWKWTPEDAEDESVRDILILDSQWGLVAHGNGVREVKLAEGELDQDHLVGRDIISLDAIDQSIFAIEIRDGDTLLHSTDDTFSEWTTNTILNDGSAMDVDLSTDSDEIHIRISRLLGSYSCSIPVSIAFDASLHCANDAIERRHLFSHGHSSWIDDGQTLQLLDNNILLSAWSLGLPNGTLWASHENALWIENEGLWSWNGTSFNPLSQTIPTTVSSIDASLSLESNRLIVTTGNGVAISDENTLSGRIPSEIKIDALNRVPLTVIALSGEYTMGLPSPSEGHIHVSSWAGQTLDLEVEESILLRGYLPAIRGLLDGEVLIVDDANLSVPSPPGQPSFDAITFGVVSMADAEKLAASDSGDRTFVLIGGQTLLNTSNFTQMEAAVLVWSDEQADLQSANLRVDEIKLIMIENKEIISESFSMLFLIFGTFVIFAGILLVINIFVMLADERKPEMGMARAIGMQRSDLRTLFVQEGALLGLISSACGSILGIGVAWVLMQFMDVAFSDAFSLAVTFDWTLQSLLAGFATGFLVTWSTLWFTSLWISRLNVVAAIRSIPTRFKGGLPWWSILITLFLGFSALACFGLAFLAGSPIDGTRHAWWLLGGFLLMFAATPPLFWVLGLILPEDIQFRSVRLHRPVLLPRLVPTILGISMIFWGWNGDPISSDWEQGPYSFIILGLFLVAAGVLLLTSLAPVAARFVSRLLAPVSRRIASVLPTSLAYPLATPFRTALTMGMFSIVVFAVVVLSGYSALFGNYITELGEEAGGDYEIIAIGSDLDDDLIHWDLGNYSVEDFDSISFISSGAVQAERVDGESESLLVSIRGFDENFSNHGGLSLQYWAEEIGTPDDVWNRVMSDESLIIVDHSLSPSEIGGVDTAPTLNLRVGDAIVISDPFNNGVNRTVYVAGIMTSESSLFMSGIYMSSSLAEERFDAETNVVWFSVPDGTPADTQEAIANEIERGMIEDGVSVIVIEVVFAKTQSFFMSMFNLLQAFLALGLAVGIAGLAVVTVRNVSERQHQIGILRALGFQRSMVVSSFLIELSWVSFLGILNGAVVGIGFHYALYDRFLREEGASFLMPWAEISMIVVGAYALTLLATVWPVLKAASIKPAEALRDVE